LCTIRNNHEAIVGLFGKDSIALLIFNGVFVKNYKNFVFAFLATLSGVGCSGMGIVSGNNPDTPGSLAYSRWQLGGITSIPFRIVRWYTLQNRSEVLDQAYYTKRFEAEIEAKSRWLMSQQEIDLSSEQRMLPQEDLIRLGLLKKPTIEIFGEVSEESLRYMSDYTRQFQQLADVKSMRTEMNYIPHHMAQIEASLIGSLLEFCSPIRKPIAQTSDV
jgi:hypothetical protein